MRDKADTVKASRPEQINIKILKSNIELGEMLTQGTASEQGRVQNRNRMSDSLVQAAIDTFHLYRASLCVYQCDDLALQATYNSSEYANYRAKFQLEMDALFHGGARTFVIKRLAGLAGEQQREVMQ